MNSSNNTIARKATGAALLWAALRALEAATYDMLVPQATEPEARKESAWTWPERRNAAGTIVSFALLVASMAFVIIGMTLVGHHNYSLTTRLHASDGAMMGGFAGVLGVLYFNAPQRWARRIIAVFLLAIEALLVYMYVTAPA